MVTCSFISSFLGCLVTGYLYFRYAWNLNVSHVVKAVGAVISLCVGCIPLFVSYNLEPLFGSFYVYYRHSLYFIFTVCILLFSLTLLEDIVFGCLSFFNVKVWEANFLIWKVNVAVSLICAVFALYAGLKVPEIKVVELLSDKINSPVKIAVLTDIHVHRVIDKQKVEKIVQKVNEQNPDVILLGGDVLDDDINLIRSTASILQNLHAKYGVYFVTGNHEFYVGYDKAVTYLKSLGFNFLENSGINLGNIYLAGIPDSFVGKNFGKDVNIAQAFEKEKNNQFRLLLSHSPTDFTVDNNFDLEISGHTHGGQIFPFHVLSLLGNKYLSGFYDMENNAKIYVSNGAGQWGPQMRFLAPAEITIVNLKPESK